MASQAQSLLPGATSTNSLITDTFKSLDLNADSEELYEDTNVKEDEFGFQEEFSHQNPYESLADWEEEEASEEVQQEQTKPQTADPRLKELGRLNAQINRMRLEQLKKRLKQFNLDASGSKIVLQKRLKNYYKRKDLKENDHFYKYYLVIDFEATCDVQPHSFRHEIIEFPAVLVSTKKRKIVGEFQSYVHPVINPKLTTFCTNLTGITQDKVNFAPKFPEVLKKFEEWMKEKKLKTDMRSFAVVTDGPWDMGRFLYHQCNISKVPFPRWGKTWINIKKPFCNFYGTEKVNLQSMLSKLGMEFIGQPHCGLDDARNIARVTIKLHEDGANMRVNEQICFKKPRNCEQKLYTVMNISRNMFTMMLKRRKVDPPREGEEKSDTEEEDDDGDESQLAEDSFEGNHIPKYEETLFDSKNDQEFPSLLARPR